MVPRKLRQRCQDEETQQVAELWHGCKFHPRVKIATTISAISGITTIPTIAALSLLTILALTLARKSPDFWVKWSLMSLELSETKSIWGGRGKHGTVKGGWIWVICQNFSEHYYIQEKKEVVNCPFKWSLSSIIGSLCWSSVSSVSVSF